MHEIQAKFVKNLNVVDFFLTSVSFANKNGIKSNKELSSGAKVGRWLEKFESSQLASQLGSARNIFQKARLGSAHENPARNHA